MSSALNGIGTGRSHLHAGRPESSEAGASSAATSSYNFIQQMIAREAKAASSASAASLSVSA
jgi:hypothetical protein